MTEQEKREKLKRLSEVCDKYYSCDECPITFGTNWCGKYTLSNLPVEMLDEVLKEAIEAVGDHEEVNMVNHPSHYNREGAMETIDEMELLFGIEATFEFCRLNAWKYRARAQNKNGEEDMQKSDWYIRKAAELKTKMKMEGIYERRTENI